MNLPCRKLQTLMESHSKQGTREGMGTVYRIVVSGELSERFAPAFEGMKMKTKGGQTVLTGYILDQTRLHGILDRISGMGLRLVSVNAVSDEPQNDAEGRAQTTGGER
jgi:hypothetical protein